MWLLLVPLLAPIIKSPRLADLIDAGGRGGGRAVRRVGQGCPLTVR